MGEPRQATAADRAAVRALATQVLSSVAADAEMPLGLGHCTTLNHSPAYLRSQVQDLVYSLAAEIIALQGERDHRGDAIWAVIDMFEGAAANFRNRGAGGQHVPYHGDFASLPPSAASQMRRWIRDLMEALHDRWPMNRAEFSAAYPSVDAKALDEMFKERLP